MIAGGDFDFGKISTSDDVDLNSIKDVDVLARPVLEWRSSKDLDINVAKTLLNAIGLDLRAMIGYPDSWHIVSQSCRDEDPGLMCGDARYIFE